MTDDLQTWPVPDELASDLLGHVNEWLDGNGMMFSGASVITGDDETVISIYLDRDPGTHYVAPDWVSIDTITKPKTPTRWADVRYEVALVGGIWGIIVIAAAIGAAVIIKTVASL